MRIFQIDNRGAGKYLGVQKNNKSTLKKENHEQLITSYLNENSDIFEFPLLTFHPT